MHPSRRRSGRPRAARRGFTLIELVVAMFLISVALVSTAALMGTNLRFQRSASSREEMLSIVEDKLDEYRAYQLALKGTTSWTKLAVGGSLTSSVSGYADSVTTLSGGYYRRRWEIIGSTAGTRQLTVRAQPISAGGMGPSALDFRTLIFVQ